MISKLVEDLKNGNLDPEEYVAKTFERINKLDKKINRRLKEWKFRPRRVCS